MKPVKIGLLGLGTVGGGVVAVLRRNAGEIARRVGRDITIHAAAARRLGRAKAKAKGLGLDSAIIAADAEAVIDDPECDIIVELIGGYEPARALVLRAIAGGKHVVTANKALIAKHGAEIFAAARDKGVMVSYEAAVGGGIPIIKALREGLAGNRIAWIAGIINGTGNFILSEMRDHGRDFAAALQEAQSLGYAEADPAFDIEGIDAAHKLTILAAIAFGVPLNFDACYTEGISRVSAVDIAYARELGYTVKHLGIARRADGGIETRVHPALVPQDKLLANVNGVMNAVLVMADAAGPTLHYGAGAGAEPTASAVVADIIDVARAAGRKTEDRVPLLGFRPEVFQAGRSSPPSILPMEAIETSYYLRMTVADRAGVLADIAAIFGRAGISIEAVIQKDPQNDPQKVPGRDPQARIIMLTHKVKEARMNAAIADIERLDSVFGAVTRIRVESLS